MALRGRTLTKKWLLAFQTIGETSVEIPYFLEFYPHLVKVVTVGGPVADPEGIPGCHGSLLSG